LQKTGSVVLPLHYGHAPPWLVKRMKELADKMALLMVMEHGPDSFLKSLADPYWFQAFGCVLGFDWHSSGLTTVVCGVLKDVLRVDRHGLAVAGGKGNASRHALAEIDEAGSAMGLSSGCMEELNYSSRICAKVDNSAIQAGYPLYHHSFFMSERGRWAVVQQGINAGDRTARRYHWLSEQVSDYVVEPHSAIVGDFAKERVLNMTAREAEENRKACVDLVRERPPGLETSIRVIASKSVPLDAWTGGRVGMTYGSYEMPADLNWRVFSELYDVQPRGYEELLAFRGVGPATVRALALVAQLEYGRPASWRDPVKFSFAHGGKDGVPYPVNRAAMDGTIRFLRETLEAGEIERREKEGALQRLAAVSKGWGL
jgi:hypothetical protein